KVFWRKNRNVFCLAGVIYRISYSILCRWDYRTCDYWNLSTACGTARASHLFDNPATVFFSIFMALW
ncbi:hypothetical protein E2320_005909, partial [Naja naja]